MKKSNYIKVALCILACVFSFTGCSDKNGTEKKVPVEDWKEKQKEEKTEEPNMESGSIAVGADIESSTGSIAVSEIVDADWSKYFNGLNGEAVIYDPSNGRYFIYNVESALIRRSPCSTFKIISSLIALENGIFEAEDSTRIWSGEIFWNEDWNRDINFHEAFRTSCVWYYRQVIDDIGEDIMQTELNKPQYGNCDISDWEGKQSVGKTLKNFIKT